MTSAAPSPNKQNSNTLSPWRFCLAPMMDYSDRHCRYLWRLISSQARMYSEMVVTGALIHGDKERFLRFNPEEKAIALQIGGSDPKELAQCSVLAEEWGYDEVNLNCGCPSDRVQKGKIGAILMTEPELVAQCVERMQSQVSIPVTVKHRIGVDEIDDYASLENFVRTVAEAGCETFIVHARKAWLKGLSPKQNREIPPLQYDMVKALKNRFPKLNIIVNGGIQSLDQSKVLLKDLDGVMLGREPYSNPWLLSEVDQQLFGQSNKLVKTRIEVLEAYAKYCEEQVSKGTFIHHMSKHALGLFSGQPGARVFRRRVTELHASKQLTPQSLLEAGYEISRFDNASKSE